MLCPFQVNIGKHAVQSVGIWSINDQYFAEVLGLLVDGGLTYFDGGDKGTIAVYPGTTPLNVLTQEGMFYLDFYLDDETHKYSEVFCVKQNLDGYLKITYGNTTNLYADTNVAVFENNFKYIVYLDTRLSRPEYTYEEEATSRLGYTFVESSVSKKTYKFVVLATESLLDALRIIRLCDNVLIESEGDTYKPITFNITPEWQEDGDLAEVTAQFDVDNIVMTLGGYQPGELGGDYLHQAYSDDYLNS
jgi:hypothetical protein